MAVFLIFYLLVGPAVVLAIWFWLRSRRDPIAFRAPMEIGRVLAGAFGAFGHWRVVLLAIVIVGGVRGAEVSIIRGIAPLLAVHADAVQRRGITMLAGGGIGLIAYLLQLLFHMPAIYALIRMEQGEAAPWQGAFAVTVRRYPVMIAITILTMLGISFGLVLFIVPALILLLNWTLVLPVQVTEETGILATMARSRALTAGSRGRIFLVYLIFGVMTLIVFALVGLAQRFGAMSITVRTILQVVTGVVAAILGVGIQSSLYVELRRIREGMTAPGLAEVFA